MKYACLLLLRTWITGVLAVWGGGMALGAELAPLQRDAALGRAWPGVLPGLTQKDGALFKDGLPYRGVGANYFDLFLRLLNQPTNQSSVVGLAKLAEAGIPFVRFAGPYSAREWKIYVERREDYFARLDQVVRTAEQAKIGLIPSLFWTLSLSETVGEPRDQWGNPDSLTLGRMRQYVGDVVERYKDSPALWGWEFGNEPNLGVDLPNAAQFRPKNGSERDDVTSMHMIVMLTEFTKEVRRHDTHRPLFAGHSHPRATAWHNTQERSWKSDTFAQFRQIIQRDNPAPLDTISIHIYGGEPVAKELGTWVTNRLDYLRALKSLAMGVKRPVFIGEFGLDTKLDAASTRVLFDELIADMEQTDTDLAAFWVFDLAGQKDTWSVTFDNDRAYMIQLTAEANRRWNRAARPASPAK